MSSIVPYDGSGQRKRDFRTAVEDVKAIATVIAIEAESVLGRRTAQVLGVLAFFAVVVGVLLVLLDWYIAPTDAEQKQALVVTLAQILGGAALLSGIYFTWRTLQVNREGQITERFTRAIDQLGGGEGENQSLEIRLGGIYALERIAKESKEDFGVVMEILTAYVRKHAPRQRTEVLSEQIIIGKRPSAPPPRSDIQAILTVLGRRISYDKNTQQERLHLYLDLHETDLHGAELRDADLEGAILVGADLRGTWLVSCSLTDATLTGADLSGANLQRANLQEANLQRADLRWADLQGANLQEADLVEADLQGAANLQRANLREANLYRANLRANLQGAKLQRAVNLTQDQIEWAVGSNETELPEGLDRPEWWSKSFDEQVKLLNERSDRAE